MRSLFETLFYGDYSVFDRHATAAILKREEACDPYYDKVQEQFGLEFLGKMNDAANDATEAELLSAYAAGIRFGGRFMLELLSDSEADT